MDAGQVRELARHVQQGLAEVFPLPLADFDEVADVGVGLAVEGLGRHPRPVGVQEKDGVAEPVQQPQFVGDVGAQPVQDDDAE
ncbi:MAG: hypothetical protein LC623_03745 [Halobacteriales archaeon]|nr:hypothetical protein [Halobacteriales archaeon]